MSMPHAKLLVFAAALAAVFGLAALAGAAIGPDPADEPAGHAGASEPHGGGHGSAPQRVRGLAVADGGLRLAVETPDLRRGREQALRFRIVGRHGEIVRDFDVEHERRLHLILARRDLTGFQHLHPEQAADGSWSTRVRLDAAGSYRLFADFVHDGEARTLAGDLRVDGAANLRPLPDPRPTAVADGGYEVRLEAGDAHPGREADLRFAITRGGVPVDTEPYLGAGGHLVALREGDLAFLHVHPAAGDSVRFAATFPTAGRYRLFLQFKHEGRVRTAAFTQEVS
jgi:hypothetical protein